MSTQSSRLRSVGQIYNQFKLTNAVEIPELQCLLRELIHEPSGAQIMHIEMQIRKIFFVFLSDSTL